jgi:alpha-beta hydrolase superfamily lysophospholipase
MRPLARHIAAVACLSLAGCAPGLQPPPAGGRAPTEIGAGTFRAADGTEFPMRSWLPDDGKPRAIIVALHGFGDYSVAFRSPAAFWAARGIATFAYDQRGFGGSPHVFHWAGAETMADDAKSVVGALRRRYPRTPVYLLGESMGGSVAIVATAESHPAEIDGLILVSPAVWEHNLMGSFERSALWLAGLAAPGLWLEPPRGLGIHPSDNIEMLRAMGRDSLVQGGARVDTTAGLMDIMDRALVDEARLGPPTLALFGAHEEVLPHAAVAAFLARLPDRDMRVAIYPEGYHMLLRDLHGEIVARDIATWIMDRSERLPSGDECAAFAADSPPCRPKGS